MTQMIVLNLKQGSDQWKGIRGEYLVASEAPVIMGASPHMRRDELLHMKKTGDEKEISSWVERFVFRPGHEAEAAARPIAEDRLGEELYPVTGTRVVFGLPLLASFDGITAPLYDDSWEHKTLNEKLREFFESGAPAEALPLMYAWQLEHQLLVAGTDSCIFAASNGTEETYHEIRYHSIPERREQLIEGWRLFLSDLEAYEPREPQQEVIPAAQTQLPTVSVRLDGQIAVISNLDKFGTALTEYVENLNLEPETDQEFADLKAACKSLKNAEDALAGAENNALAQIDEVEQMRRTVAQYREVARQARLAGGKAVKAQEQAIKMKTAYEAKAQFDEHIATLNKALGGNFMPAIPTDFNGAMKNKRTVDSLRSAANDESARARIEANRIASRIEKNLEVLATVAGAHKFLFADSVQLVQQHEAEALEAIVKNRVRDHEEAERQREEKIRAEERAKAEREAAEKARLQEEQRLAEEQRKADEAKAVEPPAAAPEAFAAARSQPESKVSSEDPAIYDTGRPAPRPTDEQIIEVLALHYRVHESKVIEWLLQMDMHDASDKMAANL